MPTGLLQQKNSNFESITRRKFAAIGHRFLLSPVSSQWHIVKQIDGKTILLERVKISKPPTEFQDVCLKTFCAVRARLQLEDFNIEGQAICCAQGFSLSELVANSMDAKSERVISGLRTPYHVVHVIYFGDSRTFSTLFLRFFCFVSQGFTGCTVATATGCIMNS